MWFQNFSRLPNFAPLPESVSQLHCETNEPCSIFATTLLNKLFITTSLQFIDGDSVNWIAESDPRNQSSSETSTFNETTQISWSTWDRSPQLPFANNKRNLSNILFVPSSKPRRWTALWMEPTKIRNTADTQNRNTETWFWTAHHSIKSKTTHRSPPLRLCSHYNATDLFRPGLFRLVWPMLMTIP